MDTTADFRELDHRLTAWLGRVRWRAAGQWGLYGLLAGLAAGLGLALVARLTPVLPPAALAVYALAFAGVGLVTAAALGYVWPRPRLLAARYFDQVFGLAERTSMALELAGRPDLAPDWLAAEQWADAAQAARRVQPGQRLPLWAVRRLDLLLAGLLSAALAAALWLPNPQQAVLAHQQAAQTAIAEQAARLEALSEQIQADPDLTPEQKQELLQPLQAAQDKLREPNLTEAQALEALAEAQRELRALQDPAAEARAEALREAGQTLSQNATTQAAGEALAQGDFQSAADALSGVDPAQLSPAEQQALAEQLEQAASQLQATDPATAQQLQAAAEALRQGDAQAAGQALDQAAQSLAEAGQQTAQSQAADQAAAQAASAQQAIAQAGQPGQGQGQQGQGQQGQGQGQGQGQQGQGAGTNGNNSGQGSSGAGTGSGNGQAQGGQAGGPVGQDNGPGDGGEQTYEPIYAPYHLGGAGGPETVLPEQGGGQPGDDVIGQGPADPQNTGSVNVPYNQVFPGYRDAAYSAVDQGAVPPELVPVVRDYFSSLEP